MNNAENIEIKVNNVFINFTIVGAGWMDVILFLNGKRIVIDWVSYICDPFSDMARNAVQLQKQIELKYPFITLDREGSDAYFIGLIPLHKTMELILYKGVTDPFSWDEEEVQKIEVEIITKEKFINDTYNLLQYIKQNFTEDNRTIGWDEFPEKEFLELERLMNH